MAFGSFSNLCYTSIHFTYFSGERNLALGRPCRQSSTLWAELSAEAAVDGDPGTCAVTSRDSGSRWWQVSEFGAEDGGQVGLLGGGRPLKDPTELLNLRAQQIQL